MRDFHLYIDASYSHKKRTGRCAGILIDEDENEYTFSKAIDNVTIKNLYQNKDGNINSSCYEIFSLYLILPLLKFENANIIVYTDCEEIFKVFYGVAKFKSNTNRYCCRLMRTINRLIKSHNKLYNISFEIRWVPGHKNIYYNTIADNLTRNENDVKMKFSTN